MTPDEIRKQHLTAVMQPTALSTDRQKQILLQVVEELMLRNFGVVDTSTVNQIQLIL